MVLKGYFRKINKRQTNNRYEKKSLLMMCGFVLIKIYKTVKRSQRYERISRQSFLLFL